MNLDTGKFLWTNHALRKIKYYGLSKNRVKRVVNNPKRIEEGIAPNTIAVMQPASTHSRSFRQEVSSSTRGGPTKEEWSSEIWAMYQVVPKKAKIRIITAWRYPGKSPIRGQIPIPQDVMEELWGGIIIN